MRTTNKSESGFGHVLMFALVALVIGVIGYAGWRVMDAQTDETNGVSESSTSQAVVPDKIQSKKDLEAAKTSLNQTNLDSDLNPSSLDGDVNSLL